MDEVVQMQRRTQAYWWVDGIAEAIGGFALVVVGGLLYLSRSTGSQELTILALGGMILLFPLSARAIRWLKERITHPRTGFVRFPAPERSRRSRALLLALAMGVFIASLALAMGNPHYEGIFGATLTVGLGSAVAVALAIRARRMAISRFYLSAIVVAVATVWAALESTDFIMSLGVMWLALGAVSIVTGLLALGSYAREHPSSRTDAV